MVKRIDRKWIVTLVVLAMLIVLLVATAPALHGLWFDVFWKHPTGWVLVIASIWLLVRALGSRRGKPGCMFWATALLVALGLFAYGKLADGLGKWYLVKDIQAQTLQALPETTEVRFLPLEVAERYARNKIQDSMHRVGDIDPMDAGQEIDWTAPRVPTGWWNYWFGQADGFLVVKPDGQVETIHQAMKYGEGMAFTRRITWPLWRARFAVDLPEFYYLQSGQEVLAIAPYVAYRYVFPVQVPYWGGVFVVHAGGEIEDLSPQQAMADARFRDQWLFPEALARAIGKAWAYRGGVLNAWLTHNDQAEVPEVPGSRNQMPYLLPTPEGPKWFFGLEPHGPSLSIFKMLFVDARSGVVEIQELSKEEGLIGPGSALGYVRSAFPTYNWYRSGDKESSGDVIALEPRPIIKGGVLYWQASVTNTAYAAVRRTALVNAHTGNVIYVENMDEMQAFLAGSFAGHGAETAKDLDLADMSDADLLRLLRRVADEMERRNK